MIVGPELASNKEWLFARSIRWVPKAAGYPVGLLDHGLLVVLALAIAVSIQVVGMIPVVAKLMTPAATAHLLTDRFGRMLLVAVGSR